MSGELDRRRPRDRQAGVEGGGREGVDRAQQGEAVDVLGAGEPEPARISGRPDWCPVAKAASSGCSRRSTRPMNGGGKVSVGCRRTHCPGGGSSGGAPSTSSGPWACDRSPSVPSTGVRCVGQGLEWPPRAGSRHRHYLRCPSLDGGQPLVGRSGAGQLSRWQMGRAGSTSLAGFLGGSSVLLSRFSGAWPRYRWA
jgi:hypothetical protein